MLYERDDRYRHCDLWHEASAGFMALADAQLYRVPGIACVSHNPGASKSAIAIHTAEQDSVALNLLVGQIPTQDLRRASFQAIDYGQMFDRIAKWAAEITDPDRALEVMLRRWVIERTFGWMIQWRRLVRDYEKRVPEFQNALFCLK